MASSSITLNSALVGAETSVGTTGKVTKFTGPTTIGDSVITENGGNIDINAKLDVVSTSAGAETFPIVARNADSTAGTKVGIAFVPTNASGVIRYSAIEGIQEDGGNLIGLGFITGVGSTINEKMRISAAGDVGIGKTPETLLDLYGTDPILTIGNSTTNSHGIVWEGNNSFDASIKQTPATGNLEFKVGRNSSWGGDMSFIVDDTTALTITGAAGAVWMVGNCSALSFTDRTPFYDGDALTEISIISGSNGEIDHDTLPSFAKVTKTKIEKQKIGNKIQVEKNGEIVEEDEEINVEITIKERDLGAMISILTKAVQQLTEEVNELKKRNESSK